MMAAGVDVVSQICLIVVEDRSSLPHRVAKASLKEAQTDAVAKTPESYRCHDEEAQRNVFA